MVRKETAERHQGQQLPHGSSPGAVAGDFFSFGTFLVFFKVAAYPILFQGLLEVNSRLCNPFHERSAGFPEGRLHNELNDDCSAFFSSGKPETIEWLLRQPR